MREAKKKLERNFFVSTRREQDRSRTGRTITRLTSDSNAKIKSNGTPYLSPRISIAERTDSRAFFSFLPFRFRDPASPSSLAYFLLGLIFISPRRNKLFKESYFLVESDIPFPECFVIVSNSLLVCETLIRSRTMRGLEGEEYNCFA